MSSFPRDKDGDDLYKGDLVSYKNRVWKLMNYTLREGNGWYVDLKNIDGIRNGVKATNVTGLGPDKISGLKPSEKKTKLHIVDNRGKRQFKPGDSVCTKPSHSGDFKSGKVVSNSGIWCGVQVWGKWGAKVVDIPVEDLELISGSATKVDKKEAASRRSMLDMADRAFGGNGGSSVYDIGPEDDIGLEEFPWPRSYYDYGSDLRKFRERNGFRDKDRKRDQIPTGELIEDEAKRLANEDRRSRIMGKDKEEKEKAPKIKKRKGEW